MYNSLQWLPRAYRLIFVFRHLSYNKFPNLPTRGLEFLEEISVKGNHKLKDFPPPRRLPRVKELELEYAYHCCAFLNAKPKQDLTNNYTVLILFRT